MATHQTTSKRSSRRDPIQRAIIPRAGKADIHVHTSASDGAPSPRQLLEYIEHHTDLDVVAITDHDTLDGALEAAALHRDGDYRFDLIIGEEVTSTAGHIIGLFLTKAIPAELSAQETIKRIHRQGGLAIAAHPLLAAIHMNPDMLTSRGVGVDVLMNEQFDGIEIINGSPTMKKENARARMLNRTVMFRAELGGSDAHIPEAVGKGYTLFPGQTAAELRQAIEQKTTEAVSARYHVREVLKYVRFFLKMKIREIGRILVGGVRTVGRK